jgi:lipoprotein NlpI
MSSIPLTPRRYAAYSIMRWVLILIVGIGFAAEEPTTANSNTDAESSFRDGVLWFFDAQPVKSADAFNKMIELTPSVAPQLWQRGLSLYYAERFAEGHKQFELHQSVNPNDVENAVWHFLCVTRLEGVEAARKALIPIVGDTRVPMRQIYALFAGTGTVDAVLAAADDARASAEVKRDQLCYAHLYLGLYYEALKQNDLAKKHLGLAANEYRMDHYMGKTAQVHLRLRKWDK